MHFTSAMLFGMGFPSSFNLSSFFCASFAQVYLAKAFSTSVIVHLQSFAASCFWLVWSFYKQKYKELTSLFPSTAAHTANHLYK